MTDADVEAMAREVLASPVDDVVETEWRSEGLASLRKQEQRQMSDWKLARFLRDEASMKSVAAALAKTRAAIGYLETP